MTGTECRMCTIEVELNLSSAGVQLVNRKKPVQKYQCVCNNNNHVISLHGRS